MRRRVSVVACFLQHSDAFVVAQQGKGEGELDLRLPLVHTRTAQAAGGVCYGMLVVEHVLRGDELRTELLVLAIHCDMRLSARPALHGQILWRCSVECECW